MKCPYKVLGCHIWTIQLRNMKCYSWFGHLELTWHVGKSVSLLGTFLVICLYHVHICLHQSILLGHATVGPTEKLKMERFFVTWQITTGAEISLLLSLWDGVCKPWRCTPSMMICGQNDSSILFSPLRMWRNVICVCVSHNLQKTEGLVVIDHWNGVGATTCEYYLFFFIFFFLPKE